MPASRMDLRMIKEVLRLKLQAGLSHLSNDTHLYELVGPEQPVS